MTNSEAVWAVSSFEFDPWDKAATGWVELTHPDHPGFVAKVELRHDLSVQAFEVRALDAAATVTAQLLRSASIGEIATAARAWIQNWWLEFDTGRPDDLRRLLPLPQTITGSQNLTRPGRRGRPDIEYARIAALYVKALAADPRKPMQRLSLESKLDPSQLHPMLDKARKRGLLTADASQGKAQGALTAKAETLLVQDALERMSPDERAFLLQRQEKLGELARRRAIGELDEETYKQQFNALIEED
jgi:hypothetical protein